MTGETDPFTEVRDLERSIRHRRLLSRIVMGLGGVAAAIGIYFAVEGVNDIAEGLQARQVSAGGVGEIAISAGGVLAGLGVMRAGYRRSRESTQFLRRLNTTKAMLQGAPLPRFRPGDDPIIFLAFGPLVPPETEGSGPSNLPPPRGWVIDGQVEGPPQPPPPATPDQE